MGWRDRDWARFDESERRTLYSSTGASRDRGARTYRPSRGIHLASPLVGLAALVSVCLYLVAHYPRGHPLAPWLAFHLLGETTHAAIATSTVAYGSTYTLTGTTGDHRAGTVVVDGSWNGRPRETLTTSTASGGRYEIHFALTEHGTLRFRVRYPGGEADGAVVVP